MALKADLRLKVSGLGTSNVTEKQLYSYTLFLYLIRAGDHCAKQWCHLVVWNAYLSSLPSRRAFTSPVSSAKDSGQSGRTERQETMSSRGMILHHLMRHDCLYDDVHSPRSSASFLVLIKRASKPSLVEKLLARAPAWWCLGRSSQKDS